MARNFFNMLPVPTMVSGESPVQTVLAEPAAEPGIEAKELARAGKHELVEEAIHRQIALLWQAIAHLQECVKTGDCVPKDAAREECFEAEKLNQLVGK